MKIWKEVIDPNTRSIYYWNTITGETSWDQPIDYQSIPSTINTVPSLVSSSIPLLGSSSSTRNSRVDDFFNEVNFIHQICNELLKNNKHKIHELILKSLDNLTSILNIATPNTKIYNKYTNYKKILQNYTNKIDISNDDIIEHITQYAEEIDLTLSNLNTINSLNNNNDILSEYKHYTKRKKQDNLKNKWISFISKKKSSSNECITPPEVQSNSSSTRHDASPPEVTTTVPLAVEASSNYLSLKSKATPGDRGGEKGSDGSSIMGMMEDGAKDVLDVTSSGKPEADLREAEGEVNRRGTTPSGRTSGGTSSVENSDCTSGVKNEVGSFTLNNRRIKNILHEKWKRASECLSEEDNYNNIIVPTTTIPEMSDDNVNSIRITTPWWKRL